MKKRMLIVLAGVGLLIGVVAAPALAAGGEPQRYQVTTNTYTMALGYGHTYTVVGNPCNGGSVTATGWQWGSDGNQATHNPDETITATLSPDGMSLTFSAVYDGGWGGSPYSWSGTFPVAGGTFTVTDSLGGVYPDVAITLSSTTPTTYRNHGEYVVAMGGKADAAHSCIGMPITPAGKATGASGQDVVAVQARLAANIARLLANLEAVEARIHAAANAHATAAIQKHIDTIKSGDSGLVRAAKAASGAGGSSAASTHPAKPTHPTKPALPAAAANHPTPSSHPSKP
jgi:hypothetical protein